MYSACALGVLHEDSSLCQMIMSELKAYQFNEEYCADVSYITAYYWLINVSNKASLSTYKINFNIFSTGGCPAGA